MVKNKIIRYFRTTKNGYYPNNPILLTSKLIATPAIAISKKEYCSPVASATNPMIGGPSKNPKYPIPETVAMAMLLGTRSTFPAVLYVSGIMLLTPKPVSIHPIIPLTRKGSVTRINKPVKISSPLSRTIRFLPNRSASLSPVNLPVAITIMNDAYPAGTSRSGT